MQRSGVRGEAPVLHLSAFRGILPSRTFRLAARRTGCAPRRRRVLAPEVVCWLMMYTAICTTSMTRGLSLAWDELHARALTRRTSVSEEAFCQARGALRLGFFRLLLGHLIQQYQRRFDAAMRWKGRWRVLAADSTLVDLPRAVLLAGFFGTPRNHCGASRVPQLRLTALCSVFTGFCLGVVATPLRFGEPIAVRHLLRRCRRDDLVLLDRNFFNYAIILMLLRRGGHVLMRLQRRYAKKFRRVRRLGEGDYQVEVRPDTLARRTTPGLPDVLTMRLIRYQRRGFRPSWLLTTLVDAADAGADEMIDLYHRRWAIETVYREWKHTMDIQNLRSTTPRGVLKEIHVQVMLHDLVRWLMTEAALAVGLSAVQLSFTAALSAVRTAAFALPGMTARQRRRTHRLLLERISAGRVRQRPGRSYPRSFDQRPRNKGNGKYSTPARRTANA